ECERLRDLVVQLRKPLTPKTPQLTVKGISNGSQPLILWRNRYIARQHMAYSGDEAKSRLEHFARFCRVFPDAFVVMEPAPYYDAGSSPKGRLLRAGFHLMHGYFRDDGPLCELGLDYRERREIEALGLDLTFFTL